MMGRAGLEPATLGLKVQPHRPLQTAAGGIFFQLSGFVTAEDCDVLHLAETRRYAHRTLGGFPRATSSAAQTMPRRRRDETVSSS